MGIPNTTEKGITMYVWKVSFAERYTIGPKNWTANAGRGYAAEVDGVMFEVVDRAEDAEKFERHEDAEAFRDEWLREFEASGGTVGIESGECLDVQISTSWELVEL